MGLSLSQRRPVVLLHVPDLVILDYDVVLNTDSFISFSPSHEFVPIVESNDNGIDGIF